MQSRFIYLILAITVLSQLAFSFYFSNEIINQNQKYRTNNDKISGLSQEIEVLQNEYSRLSSIDRIAKEASASGFTPINQVINLNQE